MKIVFSGYKLFTATQIQTLKQLGMKTSIEVGQIRGLGEVNTTSKREISELDFIKHVEPVIRFDHRV